MIMETNQKTNASEEKNPVRNPKYPLKRTLIAARTSLAVIVCRLFSRAKSFAHAVRYIINIPDARAKAADASFPTLVEDGKAFFNIRRIHANGGSNSMADGSGGDGAGVGGVGGRVWCDDIAVVSFLSSLILPTILTRCGVVSFEELILFPYTTCTTCLK
jgi:hypothetical protein